MPNEVWVTLSERLEAAVCPGYVIDRPSPAELDAALDDYEARSGFRLPASYREFMHKFGPGELAGYFRISGPIPSRLRGKVPEAFDIVAQQALLEDPQGYWATAVAP